MYTSPAFRAKQSESILWKLASVNTHKRLSPRILRYVMVDFALLNQRTKVLSPRACLTAGFFALRWRYPMKTRQSILVVASQETPPSNDIYSC
eukprot:6480547-Amphidinium_carterae.1